ncbi:MAG TPA: chemotaxis protein CheB [Streptomyces sp.]|nr:chemotaxis protein CheB [Streptomyces sp.]
MDAAPGRGIVVVAASAGGLEPLRKLLAALPPDLPASVLVVLHIPANGGGALPGILDRSGPLRAAAATDGERLTDGRVYVAPPDRHLLVVDDHIRLSGGPRQNGLRPSADALFRSAALAAGPRVVAVVLSGMLDDGAAASEAVERRGGSVLVQTPEECGYDSMPRAALAATRWARSLSAGGIGAAVVELCAARGAAERGAGAGAGAGLDAGLDADALPSDPFLEREVDLLLHSFAVGGAPPGPHSGLGCPECGGPLYAESRRSVRRYSCRLGHGWSMQSLGEEQGASLERSMWTTILRFEERLRLVGELVSTARREGRHEDAKALRINADSLEKGLTALRDLLDELGPLRPSNTETLYEHDEGHA